MKGMSAGVRGFLSAAACAFALSAAAEEDMLIATGHPSYPPVMWQDGKGIVGAAPEVAKEVLDKLGVKFECRAVGSWDEVFSLAKEGKVDLIVAAYKDSSRAKYLDFSVPYLLDDVIVCVKKGASFPFLKWDDLLSKKGVTNAGESYGDRFDKYMEHYLTVKRLPSVKACLETLVSGEADYLIIGRASGIFEAGKLGLADKLEFLPTIITTQQFYMAVPKKSKFAKLLPEINSYLKYLQADGTVKKILENSESGWQRKQELVRSPESKPKPPPEEVKEELLKPKAKPAVPAKAAPVPTPKPAEPTVQPAAPTVQPAAPAPAPAPAAPTVQPAASVVQPAPAAPTVQPAAPAAAPEKQAPPPEPVIAVPKKQEDKKADQPKSIFLFPPPAK